jgi:hypothetical protein
MKNIMQVMIGIILVFNAVAASIAFWLWLLSPCLQATIR